MKLPVAGADGSSRDELRLPLDHGQVGAVPGGFVEVIAPLLRERPLAAVVTISTERAPQLLRDAEGSGPRRGRRRRRLRPARRARGQRLPRDRDRGRRRRRPGRARGHGCGRRPARRHGCRAELGQQGGQRARARAPPSRRTSRSCRSPGPTGLAVDAIRAVLSLHVRHLLLADVAVRRDLPDSVHQMRVAARRLRSALATFAPLMQEEPAGALREELKWIASELGAIRDTEVMLDRLDRHAGQLDDEADTARARAAIDPLLDPAPVGRAVQRARRAAQRPAPAARRRPHVRRDRPARDRRRLRDVRGRAAARWSPAPGVACAPASGRSSSTDPAPPGTPRGSRPSGHATRPTPWRRSSART